MYTTTMPIRRALAAAATLAAFAALPAAGHAQPSELFFSEYIEGSSNNKALEIYNGTGAAINLATSGYNVQMFFNGSATPGLTINLLGTVASGDVFVLAQSAANATILAQADQTNGSGWFNGDDAVVLRRGTTIIDVIGQIGFDPGTEWGTGLTSTADNTLRRKSTICTGDTDGGDVFEPSSAFNGFALDTVDGLGAHSVSCSTSDSAPTLTSSSPSNGQLDAATGSNIVLNFSEPVVPAGTWFSLACTVTGPKTATVSGGPQTFTLDPTVDFASGESCTLTITAANVTDADLIDPPDTLAADVQITFSVVNVCLLPTTPIPTLQGTGLATPLPGTTQRTQGVVVGDYELPAGSGQLRGFYLQDATGDGNAATSDAIFVFTGGFNTVSLGDVVTVEGLVSEFQEQTQVSTTVPGGKVVACGSGGTVDPVDVMLPVSTATDLERYEGMVVRLPQTLSVTEHFQLGRFGQVVVSSGGRLVQPTNIAAPGAAALTLQAANDLNRLIIDDGTNLQNPDPIVFGRNGLPLSAANTLRGGDTVTGAIGVMTYTWAGNAASGNAYRVRPVGALGGAVNFLAANLRPAGAPATGGRLRVASMNLLNFFNTFGAACTGGVGGAATDCRGAENATELARQVPKTVAAIVGTNADILGVIEVENDGYGPTSALQYLVDQLNAATAPGTYAFINADAGTGTVNALGLDAIKVGLLYKPSRVIPVGQTAALNTTSFVTGGDSEPRNRPALAQAFEQIGNAARLVVSVVHLKSKGSACDAPDAGDGQGNCNTVRASAAQELAAWLATDPTGSGDPDVLLMGDLNAYGKEDPVALVESSGYTNLVPALSGDGAHSYVFDGQWGSLDHALASATLRPQVGDATHWYINADEPSVLDYNTNFKSAGQVASLYAADEFRMADHNPVLVDLALDGPVATGSVTAGGGIILTNPAGTGAGDIGSLTTFAAHGKPGPRGGLLGGVNVIVRQGNPERLLQVKASQMGAMVSDAGTGRATLVTRATISDVTDPAAPIVLEENAVVRIEVDDNGEPGASDTIGISVWTQTGSLWFSSNWDGSKTAPQVLDNGNVKVR